MQLVAFISKFASFGAQWFHRVILSRLAEDGERPPDRRFIVASPGRRDYVAHTLLFIKLVPELVLQVLVEGGLLQVEPPPIVVFHTPGWHLVARFFDERIIARDAGVALQRCYEILLELEQGLNHWFGSRLAEVQYTVLAHHVLQISIRIP